MDGLRLFRDSALWSVKCLPLTTLLHCAVSSGTKENVDSSIFIDVNARRPATVRWCILRDEDVHGTFTQASRQRPPCLLMLVFIVCLRGAYPCTISPVSHQQTWVCLLFCCWLPPDIPVCCCTCCLLCLHSAFGHFSAADVQMFSWCCCIYWLHYVHIT